MLAGLWPLHPGPSAARSGRPCPSQRRRPSPAAAPAGTQAVERGWRRLQPLPLFNIHGWAANPPLATVPPLCRDNLACATLLAPALLPPTLSPSAFVASTARCRAVRPRRSLASRKACAPPRRLAASIRTYKGGRGEEAVRGTTGLLAPTSTAASPARPARNGALVWGRVACGTTGGAPQPAD